MGLLSICLYDYVYKHMKKKIFLKMAILYMKRELSRQGEFSFFRVYLNSLFEGLVNHQSARDLFTFTYKYNCI